MADDTFYGSDFGALAGLRPRHRRRAALRARPHPRRAAAHREREHVAARGAHRARARRCRTSTPRATPGRRYYGGCAEVDKAETIAIERCKALFDADHANVQAALRRQRQPGGLRRVHAARRHDPRDGAAAWAATSPTAPRCPSPASGSTPCTTASTSETEDIDYDQVEAARPRAPAQGDPRRRLGHPAAHRLRVLPRPSPTRSARSSGSTPRTSSASSPARPSPARCRTPTSSPSRRTRCCAARAPAPSSARRSTPRRIDKAVFPMMQGGPQMHTIAAKAVNFKECATPEYAAVRPPGRRQRQQLLAEPRSGSTASGRRPAAPTPTCRCTTSRGSASPASTPRRAPTRPASS